MNITEPSHRPGLYAGLEEGEIALAVRQEGFEPAKIEDPPGRTYPEHSHATARLLVILQGDMDITVQGVHYSAEPGDRIFVPGNAQHKAIAGRHGCTDFWSERLLA